MTTISQAFSYSTFSVKSIFLTWKSLSFSGLFFLCSLSVFSQQGLIQNGNFATGDLTGWNGDNNQNLQDNLTNSRVGNANNGESSLFQNVILNPGTTYTLHFDYRWVGATGGNYTMNATVRNNDDNNVIIQEPLNTTPDVWYSDSFTFTVPDDASDIRIQFYKTNGNRPFRLDNVVLYATNYMENFDFVDGVVGNPVPSWGGFKNRIVVDDVTNSQVAQVENGDGSLYQDFFVNPGTTYDVQFDYRWLDVGASPNTTMNVRFRHEALSTNLTFTNGQDGFLLDSDLDIWKTGTFSVTVPENITEIRLLFFKGNGNKPLNIDNVIVKPRRVFNPSVGSGVAFFTWDASYCSSGDYDWVVVEKGNDPDVSGNHVQTGTTTSGVTYASVSGLTDDVAYEFYVNNNCDASDAMVWEIPRGFVTRFQGNLIQNLRFTLNDENPNFTSWEGFNQNSRVDNISGEFVGFIDNDGTLRQDILVVPGVEYLISFNYRWGNNGRSGGNDITPQIRIPNVSEAPGIIEPLTLTENTSDTWYTEYFSYTHSSSSSLDKIRLQFFKEENTNQLHINKVSVVQNLDVSSDFDYIYKNGEWNNPIANATSTDDVLLFDGKASIANTLQANKLVIKPWADFEVTGVLAIQDRVQIEEGGRLVFKSTLSTTGQLKSGIVEGKAVVERYIPAQTNNRRAFRYVTSAVNSDKAIYIDWQENGRNNIDRYGTHITGSETGTNGLDPTETGNPSMFVYDTLINDWQAVTNTTDTELEAGKGYILMIRGDRKHDLSSHPANDPNADVILRANGELLTGEQTFNLDDEEDSFTLIGNPYQASVDFSQVSSTNMNPNFFWAWDANRATRGAYVAVDLNNGNNFDDVGNPITPVVATKYIQPGQSFFVQTVNNGSASVTFAEEDKAVEELAVGIFSEEPHTALHIKLFSQEAFSNSAREADAVIIKFSEQGNNAVDMMDATKFGNLDENLAVLNELHYLTIESRAFPIHEETIALFSNGYTTHDYVFSFSKRDFPENTLAYLVDAYTEEQILLNEETNMISFEVDASQPESVAVDRFSLLFEVENLSLYEVNADKSLVIYPNPSDGKFTLQLPTTIDKKLQINIYNLLGQQVFQEEKNLSSESQFQVEASKLSPGVYWVEAIQQHQKWGTKLIIR